MKLLPLDRPIVRTIIPPGDKSITHRALFFGALNRATTTIRNPSTGDDVMRTLGMIEQLGYRVRRFQDVMEIDGAARRRKRPGMMTIDCGNSGTTARIGAGFLTGERGIFTLQGDGSLAARPMRRVVEPLSRMGAVAGTTDGHMPVVIEADGALAGTGDDLVLDVRSAQVHAALVLAALRSERGVVIHRGAPMRDHTLRMLSLFGVPGVDRTMETTPNSGRHDIMPDCIDPMRIASPTELLVPGDVSSAAFFITAALLVRGSHVRVENVGLNPTRIAFLRCLKAMNARIEWKITRDDYEPAGTIDVRHSDELLAIDLGRGRDNPDGINVEEMIDELPLLALVGSAARGTTRVTGAGELRLKESDRITATATVLGSLGVNMVELDDGFEVTGPQRIEGGRDVEHYNDHRLCMLAGVAALAAANPTVVLRPEVAAVSYPEFWSDLAGLGSTKR